MTSLPASSEPEPARSCRVQIGRTERHLRRIGGWSALAFAGVGFAVLAAVRADPAWRLLLFAPLFAGFTGLIQAREGT